MRPALGVEAVTVLCIRSGQIELRTGTNSLKAVTGHVVAIDATWPVRAIVRGGSAEVLAITVPNAELASDSRRYLRATPLAQIGSPFADCLRILAQSVDLGSQEEAIALYDGARSLLLGAAKRAATVRAQGAGNVRLLSRIKTHVLANLENPGLHASGVAAELGISVRYLHKLFSTQGETFAVHVKARRLEAVGAALNEADSAGRSIVAIARGCGFSDISSFNRAFKARYGCTPMQFRHSGG
jgi:AraC-like DNA-binding protein